MPSLREYSSQLSNRLKFAKIGIRKTGQILILVALGVLICIVAQVGLRVLCSSQRQIAVLRAEGMTESDVANWESIHDALERHDTKAINKIVQIEPGELELLVRVCPVYPKGFGPVARISLTNVSNRSLIVFKPVLKRLTSPSFDHLGRLCDNFCVLWSIAGSSDWRGRLVPNWCHRIEPNQVVVLPLMDLAVDGAGLHEVKFTLDAPVYESVGPDNMSARSVTVSEVTTRFNITNN